MTLYFCLHPIKSATIWHGHHLMHAQAVGAPTPNVICACCFTTRTSPWGPSTVRTLRHLAFPRAGDLRDSNRDGSGDVFHHLSSETSPTLPE